MTVAALFPQNLTIVSLFDRAPSPAATRLLRQDAFRDATQLRVGGASAAQRNLTAAQIDAAVTRAERAVLLVAEGAGCLAAAWWARLSPRDYVSRVAGSLLIAPEARAGQFADFASPRSALPFPSIVVGADDTSQALAAEWGSRLVDGPLAVGTGRPSGRFQALLARFTSAIVEHDVQAAERLIARIGDR